MLLATRAHVFRTRWRQLAFSQTAWTTVGGSRPSVFLSTGVALFTAAVLCGGGTRSGFLSDVLLQLVAIPALIVAIFARDPGSQDIPAGVIPFCLSLIGIAAFQLVPFPPIVWSSLPGHDGIAATDRFLGEGSRWRPLSLAPRETWLALCSLLPVLATVLLVSRMNLGDRRALAAVAVALIAFSALLGVAQVGGGPASVLRFYRVTNPDDAVGFFANRNHFASLMCAGFLLLAPFVRASARERRDADAIGFATHPAIRPRILTVGVAGVLMLGALIGAKSRAGFFLAPLALAGALLVVARRRSLSSRDRLMPFAPWVAGAILLLLAPLAVGRGVERFTADPLQDQRIAFTIATLRLAGAHLPFGAGLGSFPTVYAMNEDPKAMAVNAYLNRAHDDVAELFFETGLLPLLPLLVFVRWWWTRTRRAWSVSQRPSSTDRDLARAASLVLALLALHSLVDYPLRTGGIGTLAAFCAGLLLPSIPAPSPERIRPRVASAAMLDGTIVSTPPLAATPNQPLARLEDTFEWPDAWRETVSSPTPNEDDARPRDPIPRRFAIPMRTRTPADGPDRPE